MAFFIKKKKYNFAFNNTISFVFFASMIFNNKIELFQNPQTPNSTTTATTNTTTTNATNTTTIVPQTPNTTTDTTTTTTNSTNTTTIVPQTPNTTTDTTTTTTGSSEGDVSSSQIMANTPVETNSIPQLTLATERQGTKNNIHRINISNYNQLFFVFNSLLQTKYVTKNRKYIEDIIDNYKINSIFDLSTKVLNKEKNPLYNNF